MNKETFIDLLLKGRAYHLTHPNDMNSKAIYTLGAVLGLIVVSLFWQNNSIVLIQIAHNFWLCVFILSFFTIGVISILIGLYEHNEIHRQQRIILEESISSVLKIDESEFEVKYLLEEIGNKTKITIWYNKKIIPFHFHHAQPDTRKGFSHHDRKIDLGILFIVSAFIATILSGIYYLPIGPSN